MYEDEIKRKYRELEKNFKRKVIDTFKPDKITHGINYKKKFLTNSF